MTATTTKRPTYEVVDLAVEFTSRQSTKRVLDKINFSVEAGEFVTICGPSGTGKTTLLRALAGLADPVENSVVRYEGTTITGPPEGVGKVFQNYAASLMGWRTVGRNVALGLEGKLAKREIEERVREVLKLVGLESRIDDYPRQLSGGMQQRVQIARALATRPQVLLMDEPFGALDAMTKHSMQDELQRLQTATGATFIFITHDIEEAVYLSDRVLVINGNPATITESFSVDLPRPRDHISTKETPEYLQLRHRIYDAIHHG